MKIRHLEINNFRGIKHLKTDIDSDFICLIGHGDNGKSSILTAIEYVLTHKRFIDFNDSDFYNQDISQQVSISVTLCDIDIDGINKNLFTESKYGQYIGGYKQGNLLSEPEDGAEKSITIKLTVDKTLEPTWSILKGENSAYISALDRRQLGVGTIDTYLDNNFSWGRNSLLTKLSSNCNDDLDEIVLDIARDIRNSKFPLKDYEETMLAIQGESRSIGANVENLLPKVDHQKLSLNSGIFALHQENIPIRNYGTGSKKLISCAMQMILNNCKNILLIDELEFGLEPHRIRGLIKKLKNSDQQIITTTHSPVVLRELEVAKKEISVCKRSTECRVQLKCLSEVPDVQGNIRRNAEAFLGNKIILCEGATEIGCLRALDEYKYNNGDIPAWSLSTAYFDAGGIDKVKDSAIKLKNLGYEVAIFCDNDEPQKFNLKDKELESNQVAVFSWSKGNSIEKQLFEDINWEFIPGFINKIASLKEKEESALIESIGAKIKGLPDDITKWDDSTELRSHLGLIAGGKNKDKTSSKNQQAWFKRIDLAEQVFNYVIPCLLSGSKMQTELDTIWEWVQSE